MNLRRKGMLASRSLYTLSALVVFGVTCIVVGDTAGKALVQDGTAPIFVAWTRFALAALLLLPFCGLSQAEVPMLASPRLILRALFIVGGISSILTALQTEQIANVFGAFFIGPIVAFALGALLLGEVVTKARAVLLFCGFSGVLLVVKPGFGMTAGLGLAVLAGCFYGCYLVATRWLAGAYRPRFLLFSQLLVGAICLAPIGLGAMPDSFTFWSVGLLTLSAVGSAVGNFLLVMVSRVMPAGLVAPLIYSQLISATLLGLVVFGDVPDALGLIGLAIILISGMGSIVFADRKG